MRVQNDLYEELQETPDGPIKEEYRPKIKAVGKLEYDSQKRGEVVRQREME